MSEQTHIPTLTLNPEGAAQAAPSAPAAPALTDHSQTEFLHGKASWFFVGSILIIILPAFSHMNCVKSIFILQFVLRSGMLISVKPR